MKFGLPKSKIRKVSRFFRKLPWFLGRNSFLGFLILLAIYILIGVGIYAYYNFFVKNQEVNISERLPAFKEGSYRNILDVWKRKEEILLGIEDEDYSNPFYTEIEEIQD